VSQVASTTFETVLDEFYQSGFNYIQDTSQTDRASRWVNQSYQEVCAMEKWPFLRVAETHTPPFAVEQLGRIVRVTDTVLSCRLTEGDEDMLADWDSTLTQTGNAQFYYVTYGDDGPIVNVFPVSTNNIQVVYYQNPSPLSASSDVLVVPDQFIDVIVLGAMRRGYLDGTDTAQQYQMVKQEYADRLEFMRTQLLPRPTYQSTQPWPYGSEDW
jgi:hypothetical protein